MAQHRIYYGKGAQALRTVPHRDGRPVLVQSATYGIFDSRYGDQSSEYVVVPAGTPATVDAYSSTLTARAGRGATSKRIILVTSTVGLLVGHQYLLQAADGRAELLKVDSIPSATQVLCSAEIMGDYGTGSSLRGIEVSATFPADPAADDANLDGQPFIVEWSFNGFVTPIRESIFVERGEEAQLATLQDLLELDPHLAAQDGDRREASLALARAHRDFRTDLMLAGASESDLLAGPIGRDAVVYLAAYHALKHSNEESAARRAESYQKRYQELRQALQVGAKKPQVTALEREDGSNQPVSPAKLFRPFGW
ncbi:hypothetical protein OV203_26035 [Nannocystis sp. ILAH1]|uniref:hypothetical protein n=1 Tax=Nannocystis sp. ILAH1 TaxID=2996789 RepID=UPI00226F9948|nr:hypothetical protein [Nannocystis sp. ILAH1]MCY0990630.1 hypothetical protein [Nannocystis sp. ILAH1]